MRLPIYTALRAYFSVYRFLVRQGTRSLPFRTKPSVFGSLLRNYVKRPEWLYFPGVDLDPIRQLRFCEREEPTTDDIALCTRLLKAYQVSTVRESNLSTASELWKSFIRKRYGRLLTALEGGDARQLARLMSGLFQESFLYGISSAHLGTDSGYAFFIRAKAVEELVALAESLGVVRTETPEQGVLGYALTEGLENIVRRIETELGIGISFPEVGGAYGLQIGNSLVTPEAPEHIYVAKRIQETLKRHLSTREAHRLNIVEIGAGFGGTAFWLLQLRKRVLASYSIIDLPLMNVSQGYFLGKVFGSDAINLNGESPATSNFIFLRSPASKDQLPNPSMDLLINENSMPEIPEAVVREYLEWARTRLNGILYSYNQESYSPVAGIPQTWVPRVVASVGGFRRLSRNYSWVRRGYVEEVYELTR